MASIITGACSAIELNSSPRSAPLDKACPNWRIAPLDSAIVAPLIKNDLLIESVRFKSLSCDIPNVLVERSSFEYSSTLAEIEEPVPKDASKSLSVTMASCSVSAVASFSLLFI